MWILTTVREIGQQFPDTVWKQTRNMPASVNKTLLLWQPSPEVAEVAAEVATVFVAPLGASIYMYSNLYIHLGIYRYTTNR